MSAISVEKHISPPEISRKIDKIMKDVHQGRICCRPVAAGEIELSGVCPTE